MSTEVTWQTNSKSSASTERLAAKLGVLLKGGEVIELASDLGGGKTTFVRGLARGAGSRDTVASPTFTLSKVYRAPHFEIHHLDFYRLSEPGIMASELAEIVGDPAVVTVVEWGDVVGHVLPSKRLRVAIRQEPDGSRNLSLTAPQSLDYLISGLR